MEICIKFENNFWHHLTEYEVHPAPGSYSFQTILI